MNLRESECESERARKSEQQKGNKSGREPERDREGTNDQGWD